ncbi:MAG: DUF3501 family protein [Acidimicrobiia bacterium]|nr:DUF3501 family protein [Acidimicrobiia bacterium]
MRKLSVDDIADLRAYERERPELRSHIIELKRRRRVALGDLMSILFENTETMRWQVQEMARAERMLSDEQIAHEVATYNRLIPDADSLSGTLFLELTDDAKLREWLPKLVGVQHSIAFELEGAERVVGSPQDEERLTRADTTSAVHFLVFRFSPGQVDALRAGPPRIVVDHPGYRSSTLLTDEQHAELVADLAAG